MSRPLFVAMNSNPLKVDIISFNLHSWFLGSLGPNGLMELMFYFPVQWKCMNFFKN